jgi:hypothetical protein
MQQDRKIALIAIVAIMISLLATYGYVALSTHHEISRTPTSACYSGTIPSNSTSQSETYSVFNVTSQFNNWNWESLSTFTVGSYTFDLVGSQNSQTAVYLEPQVFISVTNSQGQTQRTSVTNLGGWNGQTWPPDLSPQNQVSLFNGKFSLLFLFTCNQDVILTARAES